jgi:hypothetical protein
MSYLPEQHNEILNAEEQKTGTQITVCQKVKETVDTAGWKEIIAPTIDRMIIDTVGGKLGDTWVSGKLDRARLDERREFWIGYKQALIDLHGRIMFHLQQLPVLEEKLKVLKQDREVRYRVPLVDDTKYGRDTD